MPVRCHVRRVARSHVGTSSANSAIDAPDRTTEEFIREMRAHPRLAEEHQRLLGGFLRSADLVKFALHRPPAEECGLAMATARRFVDETAAREASGTADREEAA